MRIARFQFNMLPVNTYVLWDTASRECAIVDAGCYYPKEEETLAEFIDDNKLTVKYSLATHLHFDHCFGNSFVAKKYGVMLCAAEADEFLLQNMIRQCESFGIPFRGEIQPIGHYISDKERISLGTQVPIVRNGGKRGISGRHDDLRVRARSGGGATAPPAESPIGFVPHSHPHDRRVRASPPSALLRGRRAR